MNAIVYILWKTSINISKDQSLPPMRLINSVGYTQPAVYSNHSLGAFPRVLA